jgi:hypothetical protein
MALFYKDMRPGDLYVRHITPTTHDAHMILAIVFNETLVTITYLTLWNCVDKQHNASWLNHYEITETLWRGDELFRSGVELNAVQDFDSAS